MNDTPNDRRVGRWPWRLRRILVPPATVALVIALAVGTDPQVRAAVRERVAVLDARFAGGAMRRLYHGRLIDATVSAVSPARPGAYEWLGPEPFLPIAHALGPSLRTGPNTLATFERGLGLGFRVFEVDLVLTADGHLVCYHGGDGEDLDRLTVEAYRAQVRRAGTEPCEFGDLVQVARQRPDIRIVLDVKNRLDDVYRMARELIADTALGPSFIPQVYDFRELEGLRRNPFFAGEIFTSYRSGMSTRRILQTARRLGVRAVTLTLPRFREVAGRLPPDLAVFTHPVDDPLLAAKLRRAGARGVYTSYLTPRTVADVFGP